MLLKNTFSLEINDDYAQNEFNKIQNNITIKKQKLKTIFSWKSNVDYTSNEFNKIQTIYNHQKTKIRNHFQVF